MISPEVCVIKTDGINCDEEMSYAFETAGANPSIVHVNELRSGERHLGQFSVLAFPGGFSYGDDVASGKILATEITSYLGDQMHDFVDKKKPILGVCNGFQVLARTGLLPFSTIGNQQVTLTDNEVGRFECRWIDLEVMPSVCKFIKPEDFDEPLIPMQTAHGEGRFYTGDEILKRLVKQGQIVFRYSSLNSESNIYYPDNPNGSIDNIAGICDESGTVFGMMPHPERSLASFHPHRIRTQLAQSASEVIFNNIVTYAKEM